MKLTKAEKAGKTTKATKRTPAKKAAIKQAAFAHFGKGQNPYNQVNGEVRRVLICAALVAAGYAKFGKTNIVKDGKGNAGLFRALLGQTPYSYHSKNGRIGDNGLTAAGLAHFQARIKTAEEHELAQAMASAMKNGGEVKTLKFTNAVEA